MHWLPVFVPHGKLAQSSMSTHPDLPMALPFQPEGHGVQSYEVPGAGWSTHFTSGEHGLFLQLSVSTHTKSAFFLTGLLS